MLFKYFKALWQANHLQEWGAALGVFLGVWVVLLLVRRFVIERLGGAYHARLVKPEDEALDVPPAAAAEGAEANRTPYAQFVHRLEMPYARQLLRELGRSTLGFVLLLISFWLGWGLLVQPSKDIMTGPLQLAVSIAMLVQLGLWLGRTIDVWMDRYRAHRLEQDAAAVTTMAMLAFLGKLAVMAVVLMMVLARLGQEIGPLITSLGIVGVAAGLASQKILGDLFGSVSIVMDKPFVIGDFIVVGDKMGSVERIGLKTTRLRSITGEELVFANADLLESRIHNYKRMQERRVVFSFGIEYGTPVEKLRTIPATVRRLVEAQPHTRFDRAHLKQLGGSSLDFEVVYFMRQPDYNLMANTQQEILLQLIDTLSAEQICIAFPTQTMYVRGDGDPHAAVIAAASTAEAETALGSEHDGPHPATPRPAQS